MWKLKQRGKTNKKSKSSVSFFHTDQMNVISIIQMIFMKNSTEQNKRTACLCCNSVQYSIQAPEYHTPIVLGMEKLFLHKTDVWTLVVPNCWKILLDRFVSTHQQSQVLNFNLLIRKSNWLFDSFESTFETQVGEISGVQIALFLVFTQIKWKFVVKNVHFSFI